jgi:flavin-dependent dehydrogenase
VEGDAAGLVMKTSGEGISQALVSGEEIGWKIAHPEYPLKRLQNLIKRIQRQNRLYNIFNSFHFLRKLLIKLHARECTPPSPRLF